MEIMAQIKSVPESKEIQRKVFNPMSPVCAEEARMGIQILQVVGLCSLLTGFYLAPEKAHRKQIFSNPKSHASISQPLFYNQEAGNSALCAGDTRQVLSLTPHVTKSSQFYLGMYSKSTLCSCNSSAVST